MDELIAKVARRANVSHQSAAQAVDTVLTAVKDELPDAMAAHLVKVMAGEESFEGSKAARAVQRAPAPAPAANVAKPVAASGTPGATAQSRDAMDRASDTAEEIKDKVGETVSDVSEKVGETFSDVSETVTKVGGKAFEEAGRVGSKAIDELGTHAGKLSRWAKELIDKNKK